METKIQRALAPGRRPKFQVFHLSTVIRRRSNRINEIKLDDGSWLHGREQIGQYFTHQFKNLFQLVKPHFPQDLEELIEATIFVEENDIICRVPTEDEIQKVVFEMHPLKALGLMVYLVYFIDITSL